MLFEDLSRWDAWYLSGKRNKSRLHVLKPRPRSKEAFLQVVSMVLGEASKEMLTARGQRRKRGACFMGIKKKGTSG